MNVATRYDAHVAAQFKPVVEIAAEIEIERQIVDLERVRAPIGQLFPVQGKIHASDLKRHQMAELELARPHAGGADHQLALVVDEHANVPEQRARVRHLDHAALDLDMGAGVPETKRDCPETEPGGQRRVGQPSLDVGLDARASLRLRDRLASQIAEQAGADFSGQVGINGFGTKTRAQGHAAVDLGGWSVDGDRQLADRRPLRIQGDHPAGDDDVGVERVRSNVYRIADGQTATQDRLVERSGCRQAHVQIAGDLLNVSAHERLEQFQIEMAVDRAIDVAAIQHGVSAADRRRSSPEEFHPE